MTRSQQDTDRADAAHTPTHSPEPQGNRATGQSSADQALQEPPKRPMRPSMRAEPNPALADSTFLKAARGEKAAHTPLWFMRQAGRYMPEYRAIRADRSMLECIRTPELAAEITLQPIRAFDVDAAILFNDILTPLPVMGLDLDFVKGAGPRISNPLRSTRAVDLLGVPAAREVMPYTAEAIRMLKPELDSRGIPLIGFVGAPFTLASYAIEGGGSRNYEYTKQMMYAEPAAWFRLMDKLATVQADYLGEQIKAGAAAVQIFDSWAGALSRYDYQTFVWPATQRLIEAVKPYGVPVIYFGTDTGHLLGDIARYETDVVGVDWRTPLDTAWAQLNKGQAIQGNLDPLLLAAPWRELRHQVDRVLDEAAGRPGHIFNIGHGILPTTPMDNVRRVAEYVHERTAR
ncbi:MAG: uroporphyrinogen decarboxylase [Deinococcus sp.]|nr:uroporphyrinogen decarboxylase [Deinococcus sp.]